MTATTTRTTEEEITTLDGEIESMERELAEDATVPLSWDEITSTTAEELARKEQRRDILPRLLQAARIKRLELQRGMLQSEIEPLCADRKTAHEKLERATAKKLKAEQEMLDARQAWADPHTRIQSREARVRDIDRTIAALREGA